MDIASLYHFFGRVVQLKIDCEPLESTFLRSCCLGKQISKHQFGRRKKKSTRLIWVCRIFILSL